MNKGRLKTHVRESHRNQMLFNCILCGKEYARSGVKLHINRVHFNMKRYECNKCGFAFYAKQHLIRHMKVHNI